jgi:hypothetical protein
VLCAPYKSFGPVPEPNERRKLCPNGNFRKGVGQKDTRLPHCRQILTRAHIHSHYSCSLLQQTTYQLASINQDFTAFLLLPSSRLTSITRTTVARTTKEDLSARNHASNSATVAARAFANRFATAHILNTRTGPTNAGPNQGRTASYLPSPNGRRWAWLVCVRARVGVRLFVRLTNTLVELEMRMVYAVTEHREHMHAGSPEPY